MKLRCLIVDDEPIARQIVGKYCSYLPELDVVASCGDALQAKQILSEKDVDVLFLDINMPILDGLAFVKTLKKQPQIIFTTAYKEYAHEAFNVDACDYLLKPFSLERFIQAVDKAKSKLSPSTSTPISTSSSTMTPIYIKSEGKILKFDIDDLLYAEAQGNNVKVVTAQNTVMTTITLSAFEEQLPPSGFVRVHRSFIINKSKIRVIEGNRILIGTFEVPIGSNYRENFLKAIGLR
jgi:DNA-binding LytR/AlgR family response regulator